MTNRKDRAAPPPIEKITVWRDDQAELLDDIADLCEHWKRNRSKGRTPNAIRLALTMLAADVARTTAPTNEFMDALREWLDLRDADRAADDSRSIPARKIDRDRMTELEGEINKMVGGHVTKTQIF